MSLKPPKKSDSKKTWIQPRRDRAKIMQPEYHLIISEGEKTEPAYFNAICDAINEQYKNRIHLEVYGEGDNTLGLLNAAQKRVGSSPNFYRHVWVIYDTDDFPVQHINATAERCESLSTEDIIYHAIWSNQCIELWFLLHFSYMHSDLHRKEYGQKLSSYLRKLKKGEYKKNREDMYEILYSKMDTAIENAKRLNDANGGKLPSESAPGTKVYELIETLKPYLRK